MKNGLPFHIPFDNLIRLLQLLYQDTGYIAFKSSSYTCILSKYQGTAMMQTFFA